MKMMWIGSLAALLMHAAALAAGPPALTAWVGATLIDGTDAPARPDAVVLVAGERIAAVGRLGQLAIPENARVVEVSGKWLMPGLIDAHVHFFQSGGLYTRPDVIDLRDLRPYAEEVAWIKARLPATLARYLASGVTAVVDMGGPFWNFELRELARRTQRAPRVAVAGPLISTYLPPELESDDPPIIRVDSPAAARVLARRELDRRPELVKFWFIHMPGDDLAAQAALLRAVAAESHAAGVRVAVHATELAVARAALAAGADVLVHSVDDRRVDDGFVRRLRARQVPYIPTLMVQEGYREVLGRRVRLSEIERRLGDPAVIATFADLERLPGRAPFWAGRSPSREVMFWNLRRLQAAGVPIAAGTDAGNIGTLHGPALHRELELMAEAGLPPAAILRAATQGGARVMGRSDALGTIEAGKLADMLLLDADPLADIRNTRRIHRVIKGGVAFDPQQIVADMPPQPAVNRISPK